MAIATANKRTMALRAGMTFLAGTRPPNGNLNKYDRAALLGCYIPDPTRIVVLDFNLAVNRNITMELIR